MGFNDFWINNNGKKEHLNKFKHGVRKEQVDEKFHNLFDAYDANGDGTLESEELSGIFKQFKLFAGEDKVLDAKENELSAIIFKGVGIRDTDFMGFVKSVSKLSEDIVETKTIQLPDGGKEFITKYKDGSVEKIAYYPDGKYKYKKFDFEGITTETFYTIAEDSDTRYTEEQIEERIKRVYEKYT